MPSFYQNRLFISPMKTGKFPRSVVAPSVPIYPKFTSREPEKRLTIASCRDNFLSLRESFSLVFPELYLPFFPTVTAWHPELSRDLFVPI